MEAEFKSELNRVLHGNYEVTGYSSYATLAVDTGSEARRRMGTELHEWVHSELSDMSTYGWFQQFLAMVSRNADRELRSRARRVFDDSMAASSVTQEGLASLREFAWVTAHESENDVAVFLGGIPEYYRTGLDRALIFFDGMHRGSLLDRPYLGYSPPAFHVAVVTLGLVIMNSPVLPHYSDPEVVLGGQDLRWISRDGPDQRFEMLLDHRETIADMLQAVIRLATRKKKNIVNTEVLMSVYDFGLEYARERVPGFPLVSWKECRAQVRVFKDSWIPFLNQRPGSPEFIDQQGMRDTSRDRALNMRYERRNKGPHEVDTANSDEFELALPSFVSAHQAENLADVVRLVMLTTIPPGLPEQLIPDCNVGLLSVPMRADSADESSPFARFYPLLLCETTMRDLVKRSGDLAQAGCVWYSNLSLIRSIRRQSIGLQGLIIEKCDSPALLLAVARQSSHSGSSFATFRFGSEYVLAVISDDTFSFSLAGEFQVDVFTERAVYQNMGRAGSRPLRVGRREVSSQWLARAALWGFVGR